MTHEWLFHLGYTQLLDNLYNVTSIIYIYISLFGFVSNNVRIIFDWFLYSYIQIISHPRAFNRRKTLEEYFFHSHPKSSVAVAEIGLS